MFKEYRCEYCNKLFFKGDIKEGTIEVKCRYCKNMNLIKAVVLLSDNNKSIYKASFASTKDKSGRGGI